MVGCFVSIPTIHTLAIWFDCFLVKNTQNEANRTGEEHRTKNDKAIGGGSQFKFKKKTKKDGKLAEGRLAAIQIWCE